MWVAPNMLTFVGFLFTVANFVLLSIYDFHFKAAGDEAGNPSAYPVPHWVWFLAAFNLFMAHTLGKLDITVIVWCCHANYNTQFMRLINMVWCVDGIDGKQARRTGTSGPIGELFDHGLDSWTTVFIPTGLYSVFGSTPYGLSVKRLSWVFWNVFFNFIFSHWEKYNTGVLYLPWGYDASMLVRINNCE